MHETMDMRGQMKILLTDLEGRVVHESAHQNRIVKAGRQLVAELFGGVQRGTPSKVTHMGVGAGSDSPNDDQVDLLAARPPRKPISSVKYDEVLEGQVKRIKATLQTVFDFGEVNDKVPLREAGIFTALEGGVMYNRVVFPEVTKTNDFKLTLIWDIIF